MYTLLDKTLHETADLAHEALRQEYSLSRNAFVEKPIDAALRWRPTYFWKAQDEYIACEVNTRPLPKSLRTLWVDIRRLDLFIRVMVVVPEPGSNGLTLVEYRKDLNELKELGVGCLCVNNDSSITIENHGIPIPLHRVPPNYRIYKPRLRQIIRNAFDVYIKGNPRLAVQDLGQIAESITFNLADQAKRRGTLNTGRYQIGDTRYSWATLLDDMSRDRIINRGVLGRCRAFADDRNNCSHRPRTIRQAKRLVTQFQGCFEQALRILDDLPNKLREKNYRLRFTA